MNLLNWKSIVTLAALSMTVAFQNCSAVKFTEAEKASESLKGRGPASMGGDVYGGKPFIHYLTDGLCADGTKVASIIKGSLQDGFLMTRDSCLDLNPAKSIPASLIDISSDSLVYNNNLYVSTPAITPSRTGRFACESTEKVAWRLDSGRSGDVARLSAEINVMRNADGSYAAQVSGSVLFMDGNTFLDKRALPFIAQAIPSPEQTGTIYVFVEQKGPQSAQLKLELMPRLPTFLTPVSVFTDGYGVLFQSVQCRTLEVR